MCFSTVAYLVITVHSVMAPHGKELSLDIKKSIIYLHKNKQGYQKIATTLNLSKSTVAKVVQHYQKFGTIKSVNKRSGRPRKLTARLDRYVTREVSQKPRKSATELACELSEMCGVNISAATIRRTLHRANLHSRRPRRKPLLKPRHKTARLEFARKYIEKPLSFWDTILSFWDTILWSDETKVNLFGSDGVQHIRRRAGDEYADKNVLPTVKHGGGSLMVWGCMSSQGVGELHFLEGTV